jgi:hypothetical protein
MNVPVTNPCDQAVAAIQKCLAALPVIVLGSGHSATFGLPGMDQLRDHLMRHVPARLLPADAATWRAFEETIKRLPLEAALHEVRLSSELMTVVIDETWKCCFPPDRKVLENVVRNDYGMPLARLYNYLFRSTHPRLAVVTTNYDRLAEFAADSAGYGWTTGFGQGYIGHRHGGRRLTIQRDGTAMRMVDIWKVHGSLDWFAAADGTMYSLPAFSSPPAEFTPLMVVPGVDKYRRAYDEPFRSSIAGADKAIGVGNSFLCVGYGFNDEHIQPPLLERCRRQEKPLIVLTKQLTPAAKGVLLDGRFRRFAAFEETPRGTRMYSDDYLTGVDLDDVNLWSLGSFLDKVL